MHYRSFADTGLYVSELALGTMTFGGKGFWQAIGTLGSNEVERIVGASLDAGVNLIDTADVYSEGESETLTGAALKALARPRESYLLATKVRSRMGAGPNQVGLSRAHILHSIDASLARLQLDHIDLYQIHGYDAVTPLEETMAALADTVRAGKVRYVGFCNLPAWAAMKANAIARANGWSRFVSAQVYYTIAGRDIERELVPFAIDQKLAILPWSPLAGGLLSGKFDLESKGPEGARRANFDFPPVDLERAKPVLATMRRISQETGVSVARIALAWLLSRKHVTSVIIGARTMEQLTDNLAATDVVLSAEHVAQLDQVSQLPSEYPGWMVERQGAARAPETAR